MAKNASINARVDGKLKAKAEKVLRTVGVSTTEAVTMMLHQIVLRQGLPFEVRIPNEETKRAIRDLDAGKGERFDGTAEEFFDNVLAQRR